MAWPISALNAFSFPLRNSSTDFWFAARTSSTIASSAPLSEIWRKPLASIRSSASVAEAVGASHIRLNTSLAILLEMVPSAMRASSRASCAAVTGAASMSVPARLSADETSPMIQLAACFACAAPAAITSASK